MKDIIILIAIVVVGSYGVADAVQIDEAPSSGILPWWPTQPPWWSSHWPTWPTRPPATTKPPATCMNDHKYPYPADCSKYQLCLSGTLFVLDCPKGLHYHDAIKECDLPANAKCEVSTEPPTSTTTPDITTTEDDITTTTETCVESRMYPYPSDCTKYYLCLRGGLVAMNCPVTLHYHDEIQECNRPELAKCEATTDAPTTTTEDDSTTTTELPETTTTAKPVTTTTPTTTSTTTTKPPNPGGVNCNAGMYHPHPTDCNKFYQCSNGTPYVMPCPAGLHFNTVKEVCDWPNAAGCTVG